MNCMLFCMSCFVSLLGTNKTSQAEWGVPACLPAKWKFRGCFMLTSRHWGYHISADLSYPKFVGFLWAVRHGDHTCDRAAPPRPGEARRNERLGKWETSPRPQTWLYCGKSDSPPHKRQWDETDLVWRFVFRMQFTGGASASLGYLNHFKKGWLSWSGV